jgi:hypothetical protein
MCTVKKTQKSKTFVRFDFKNNKNWNSVFNITNLSLHFLTSLASGSG